MSDKKEGKYKPDYEGDCYHCGQSPCVTIEVEGEPTRHLDMCGVCTFGEAVCIDPSNW